MLEVKYLSPFVKLVLIVPTFVCKVYAHSEKSSPE